MIVEKYFPENKPIIIFSMIFSTEKNK